MGSVIRSGPQMCKKMTQYIPSDKDLTIVEFGAGDGAITEYILKRMSPSSKLIVFEINTEMADVVKVRFSKEAHRITIFNEGAQNAKVKLEEIHLEAVDMIISAIPFMMLPEKLMHEILAVAKKILKEEGSFIQMHYSLQLKNVYEKLFNKVETSFVPLNIPPGYVLKCSK
ncbi:MAG TPA: methyltransferase domain-containing protein [Saprospiraceae bacterium]|nr:methyltransferase domain-containing protein [Saprospiraceae bacterium]